MNVVKIVMDILVALAPKVIQLVTDAMAGKDISADELWQQIPHEARCAADAEIATERRRAAGLPV